MKSALRFAVIIVTSFALTSCLDIFENITLNKNGSGTYSLIMSVNENARKMMTNTIPAEESSEGGSNESSALQSIPGGGEIQDNFKALGEAIQQVKGVSNFKTISDETKIEFGYSFDFDNVNTLNTCMELAAGSDLGQMPGVQGKGKKKFVPTARYIEWNSKTLVRHQSAELEKIMEMKKTDGSNKGMMGGLDAAYIFQDLRYRCTYTFEVPLKEFSNEAAEISEDKKTLKLECIPFAPKALDEKAAKLQAQACSQAVSIVLK
jgi:hypothetical protein